MWEKKCHSLAKSYTWLKKNIRDSRYLRGQDWLSRLEGSNSNKISVVTLLSLDGDDFKTIKIKIYLTWQPPIVISVILTKVGYSQYIKSLKTVSRTTIYGIYFIFSEWGILIGSHTVFWYDYWTLLNKCELIHHSRIMQISWNHKPCHKEPSLILFA